MKVLMVTEKPKAAKQITELLSKGRNMSRAGFSPTNNIFDFEYEFDGQLSPTSMTSVNGHINSMRFIGVDNWWSAVSPRSLFEAPIERICIEPALLIKWTLEKEVEGVDALVLWTDDDIEGESIAYEISEVCVAANPNLTVQRARLTQMTPEAVRTACSKLGGLRKSLLDAADVRAEIDLRIGSAFTRLQTLRMQRIFPQLRKEKMVATFGRCQYQLLAFIVEKSVTHKDETNDSRSQNTLAKVIAIESQNKSKERPLPLDTVEMMKLCSRNLKMTVNEVMKIAQTLYTQGFISYPRTGTNIFPEGLDLVSLVEMQTVDPNWGVFAENVLSRGLNPRVGTKTDNTHLPIHPLKYTDGLKGDEKCVYEFIVRHFLAYVSDDAKGKETTVQIEIAGETFGLSGLIVFERNYLDVYPYEEWNSKEIPHFELGETFQPTDTLMLDDETPPPGLLTEADLVDFMDEHGIGTVATYANHIETLKSSSYISINDDRRVVPEKLGIVLVEAYQSIGIHTELLSTAKNLAEDLKRISNGEKDAPDVLRHYIKQYLAIFHQFESQIHKLDQILNALGMYGKPMPVKNFLEDALPIMKCLACDKGNVAVLKKTDHAGWNLGCTICEMIIVMPDVQDVTMLQTFCHECQDKLVRLVNFKFYDHQETHNVCIRCSPEIARPPPPPIENDQPPKKKPKKKEAN